MIKGVHRQMIEITHTGSPYFERAFLVVRGSEPPEEDKLHDLARKVVEQAGSYAGLRRQIRRRWLQQSLLALGCAGCGAGILWVMEAILR